MSGLGKEPEKYTSPEIQNELLEAMVLGTMQQISANFQNATFFTIMADEKADVSSKEQLVIYIWWVDDCFVIQEDFIGMHPLERILQNQTTEIQTMEDPKLPRKGKAPVRHLENRIPTTCTFLKPPKTITNESTLMR